MDSAIYIIFFILYFSCIAENSIIDYSKKEYVVVETSNGKLVGKRNGSVISFLGIPYAEPPIGRYRFRPSRPKKPWYPDTLEAFKYSAECLQSTLFSSEDGYRDEDCLYLNIWQPSKLKSVNNPTINANGDVIGTQSLSPVMFWIYGGAFLHGSASRLEYEGNKLASRGVVVVSCNYRVGALGFLVSIPDGLFGNYGLHDQKLALQWVYDNIYLFGGDPERVTVFGESAGAMSTIMHILDQYGNDHYSHNKLFHAAIIQSNPLGYKYRSISVANFIGTSYKEILGCEDLKCLQSEPSDDLLHTQDTMMAVPRSIGDFFTWGPVITDSMYYRELRQRPSPVSNVTVRQPIETLKSLRHLDIPIIIGTNTHEGAVFVYTAYPTRMVKLVYQILVFSFFRTSAPKVLKMYEKITKQVAKMSSPDYRVVLSQIIGDYLFRCPNQLVASMLVSDPIKTSVYMYEFALPTRTPGFKCCDGLACHTCELPYVFDQIELIEIDYSWIPEYVSKLSKNISSKESSDSFLSIDQPSNRNILSDAVSLISNWIGNGKTLSKQQVRYIVDAKVSKLMADYWTTFATYFDPNGLPSINGVVSGTRPSDAPWWPRLLGELPFIEPTKFVSNQRTNNQNLKSKLLKELINVDFYKAIAWDESYRYDDNPVDIPIIYDNTIYLENKLNSKSDDLSDYENIIQREWEKLNVPKITQIVSLNSKSDKKINNKIVNNNNKINNHIKAKANNKIYKHTMRFDDTSDVHMFDTDCICEEWDKLDYKF